MSLYHPPCNNRYGTPADISAGTAIQCNGPPGHKGHHHNREAGIRWTTYGAKVPRCTWASCTAPDRRNEPGLHLCPGGAAEVGYRDSLKKLVGRII